MSINYYEHFPFGERKIKIRTTRLPLIIPVTECDRRTRQDMTMDMNKSYISCYYYYYTQVEEGYLKDTWTLVSTGGIVKFKSFI